MTEEQLEALRTLRGDLRDAGIALTQAVSLIEGILQGIEK